ncbi:hypothetical protein IG631_08515 [Alternaria alternata]|nr:hypothetical protein IG631_08515 [Alternaria alternata]
MVRGDLATTAAVSDRSSSRLRLLTNRFQNAAVMGNSVSFQSPQNDSRSESDSNNRHDVGIQAVDRLMAARNETEIAVTLDRTFDGHERPLREQLEQQNDMFQNLRLKYERIKEAYKMRDERSELREQKKISGEQIEKLHQHLQALEMESHYTSTRYNYLVEKVVLPYAECRDLQWDEQTAETIDIVVDPLIADALQADSLREQKAALQRDLLAGVEKGEAMTDEHFAQEYRNLAGLIKTLSRSIRLEPDVDVIETLDSGVLLKNVARGERMSRVQKKYMIEAWTWSVLLNLVFRDPFIMFGTKIEPLRSLWPVLFARPSDHDWPTPSVVCETWRYTTMERLVGGIVNPKIITQRMTKEKYQPLEQSLINARDNVVEVMNIALAAVSSQIDVSELHQIVDKAFALTMHMSFQRARFQVTYPKNGDDFNPQSMKSIPGSDGEELNEGIVALVVNPGLTKWGDAHGKNLDHRYDIVASLVQLEAVDEKHVDTAYDYANSLLRDFGLAVPRPEDMKARRPHHESQC